MIVARSMMQRAKSGKDQADLALLVANLPSCQVLPRGCRQSRDAGRFLWARSQWRLFLLQISPRCRGKRRSRAWRDLWWYVPEARAATTLQQN